jgi:hypothetical protein
MIVGIGPSSSQFTEKFVTELVGCRKPKGHGLAAVGIYDNTDAGPKVRRTIKWRTRRLKVDDISVKRPPTLQSGKPDLKDLVTLKRAMVKRAPTSLLLIIDTEFMQDEEVARLFFNDFKAEVIQTVMTAVCFANDDLEGNDERAYQLLDRLTQPDVANNKPPILEAAYVVRNHSPLAGEVGGPDVQYQLLAKSLAGVWTAPLYRRFNPPFEQQARQIRESKRKFIGMAVKTQGIEMKKPEKRMGRLFYPILRRMTSRITLEQAVDTITELTYALLENDPVALTTVAKFGSQEQGRDPHQLPLSVNLIVPFRPSNPKFEQISSRVQAKLINSRTITVPAPPQPPSPPAPPTPASQPAASAPAVDPYQTVNLRPNASKASDPYQTINFADTASQPDPAGDSAQPPAQGAVQGAVQGAAAVPAVTTEVVPGYMVKLLSIIKAKGVNLGPDRYLGSGREKFYCQVCVLFGMDKDHLASQPDEADETDGVDGVDETGQAVTRAGQSGQ